MEQDLIFWSTITERCKVLWREILGIPQEYEVLFIGSGAPMQYLMIPVNLLEKGAAYLTIGEDSQKALKEAKGIGRTVSLDSLDNIPSDVDYLHITPAEIEDGEEVLSGFSSPVTLIADMSADILSHPVKVKRYGLIYAGREGFSVVIIRKDILGKVSRYIPSLLSYQSYIDNGLNFDTLPQAGLKMMLHDLQQIEEKAE